MVRSEFGPLQGGGGGGRRRRRRRRAEIRSLRRRRGMPRQAESAPDGPPRATSPPPDPVLLGGRPLHQDRDRARAPLDEGVARAGPPAVQEHLDAAGSPRQHPNEGGGYGEVAQHEASAVEDGLVRVESLHGEDGESRYLADVRVDGGAVSVLRVVG